MSTPQFETWAHKENRRGIRGRITNLLDMKTFYQTAKANNMGDDVLVVSEGENILSAEEIKETT